MKKAFLTLAVLCGIGLMAGCSKFDDNIIGKWEFVQLEYDDQNLYDMTLHEHGISTSSECKGLEFRPDKTMTMEIYLHSDPDAGPDIYMPAKKGWSMSRYFDTLYIKPISSMDNSDIYKWEVVELNETTFVYIERSKNEYHDRWTKYTYRRKS